MLRNWLPTRPTPPDPNSPYTAGSQLALHRLQELTTPRSVTSVDAWDTPPAALTGIKPVTASSALLHFAFKGDITAGDRAVGVQGSWKLWRRTSGSVTSGALVKAALQSVAAATVYRPWASHSPAHQLSYHLLLCMSLPESSSVAILALLTEVCTVSGLLLTVPQAHREASGSTERIFFRVFATMVIGVPYF